MTHKDNIPYVPIERHETVRKAITTLLLDHPCTAREISQVVQIPEKEVLASLENIAKTIHRENYKLVITPCQCRKCGFVFHKRERLKKPGKCPICKSESIEDARFSIHG